MNFKTIIIFLLVFLAFGAGVYFKDDAVKLYDSFAKKLENFQEYNTGQLIDRVAKKIIISEPLNAGGAEKNVNLLQSKIIAETNLQRQLNGLPPLKENTKLNQAANAKAQDMFSNQYFEHTSPLGVGPAELVQKYGYDYILAGENLILGNFSSEKEIVQDWMDSPKHRDNILNARYTEIGVAIIKGIYEEQTVWIGVQEFGLPLSSCSQPDSNLKNEIELAKLQLDSLFLQIEQTKIEIEKINPRSAVYKQMANDYNQLVSQYSSLAQDIEEKIATYNNQVSVFNQCAAGQ